MVKFSARRLIVVSFLAAIAIHAEPVFYTFKDGDAYGVARLDVEDGKIGPSIRMGENVSLEESYKLTRVGKHVVVAVKSEGDYGILISDVEGSSDDQFIKLKGEVSELIPAGDSVLVAANKGRFYTIDPSLPNSLEMWNARKELSPPGRKGEGLLLLPDGRTAVASFQKDDDDSDATGSRFVVLGLAPLRLIHDISLPRDHPELHIDGNLQEQGPNPEKLFVFPDSNTLALTLDLYGAVAFMDLDAALRGQIKNYTAVPTSSDGTWGITFPDRGLGFQADGKDWLLVTNAAENGGFALLDAKSRAMVRHYPAKVGGETPVLIDSAGKIFSVLSGKVKRRTTDALEKEILPVNELIVFDVKRLTTGDPDAIQVLPIPVRAEQMIALSDGNLLLLHPSEALLMKQDGTILDRQHVIGSPIRTTR